MRVSQKLVSVFIKPFVAIYLKKERLWNYKGISIVVKAGVFHPRFFFSTKFMLNFLRSLNMEHKKVLELGAGTALISIFCSKKKAEVTASDINKTAIENMEINSKMNNCTISIIYSNLFESIPPQIFDYIIINPPYYKKQAISEYDYAWYCGPEGEYFVNLFKTIGNYFGNDTVVLMVLSSACDLDFIKEEAIKNSFFLYLQEEKNHLIEKNYIFQVKSTRERTQNV